MPRSPNSYPGSFIRAAGTWVTGQNRCHPDPPHFLPVTSNSPLWTQFGQSHTPSRQGDGEICREGRGRGQGHLRGTGPYLCPGFACLPQRGSRFLDPRPDQGKCNMILEVYRGDGLREGTPMGVHGGAVLSASQAIARCADLSATVLTEIEANILRMLPQFPDRDGCVTTVLITAKNSRSGNMACTGSTSGQ